MAPPATAIICSFRRISAIRGTGLISPSFLSPMISRLSPISRRHRPFSIARTIDIAARAVAVGLLILGAAAGQGGQLPYTGASDQELGLPPDVASLSRAAVNPEIPGRRILATTLFSNLLAADLPRGAVPLPAANTLAHVNFQQRRFGRLQNPDGSVSFFNPETILVQFRGQPLVAALRVELMREWDAVQT